MQNNCYDILGIDRQASSRDIKAAFRRLAKKWHPDLNPGVPGQNEQFSRIHHAYKILSDPAERARHDAALYPQPSKSRSSGTPSSTTRPSPSPREKETPKAKPRPSTPSRPQAPPPPQENLSAQFALFMKRVKELLQYAEQGAPIHRRPQTQPYKTSPDGEYKTRQASFDWVFQTVQTQDATGFVLCSDGIIRRIGKTGAQPNEKKETAPGSVHTHAWRAGLGMVVFLLVKWWHELNR